ncbi:MAG: hypothetical protein JWQ36_3386 [Enterovirga sp.]|nr:hypothetical protein [Enterovirga sp.]
MNAAKHDPCPLVEEIAIHLVGPEQRQAPVPIGVFRLHLRELLTQRKNLGLERALGEKAAIADLSAVHKIADRRPRDDIERERDEKGTESPTNDHGARMGAPWLRAR